MDRKNQAKQLLDSDLLTDIVEEMELNAFNRWRTVSPCEHETLAAIHAESRALRSIAITIRNKAGEIVNGNE